MKEGTNPSVEGDDGREPEGLSGLPGVAKAKEECGEVGSRPQRSMGSVAAWASWARRLALCSQDRGLAKRTRQPACQDSALHVTGCRGSRSLLSHIRVRGTHARAWKALPRALQSSHWGPQRTARGVRWKGAGEYPEALSSTGVTNDFMQPRCLSVEVGSEVFVLHVGLLGSRFLPRS